MSDSESLETDGYFEGFEWPVPRAFASAVVQLRFEQGDVLYPDRSGYDRLEARVPEGLKALQILQPPRSARVAALEGEGDRRLSAWEGEVVIELVDLDAGTSELRVLTQGKLFTALWRGDERWLDPERSEPDAPRTARDLHQALAEAVPAFDARRFPSARRKGCRFLFVVDESSDSSRAKAIQIEAALAVGGRIEELSLTPRETGVETKETFHPALVVRGLFMPGRSEEAIHTALRSVLYGGASTRGAAPDSEPGAEANGSSDRFSVARHGLLESF